MVFEHDYEKFPELTNKQIEDFGFSSPHVQYVEDFEAVVVKVHDGDTVTLQTVGRDFLFPLRLLRIDSFELNEGGEEAREWLKEKIEGQKVQIKMNPKNRVGKFGRLLGDVIHGGLSISDEELHLGLAVPFGSKNEGKIPSSGLIFDLKQWF